MTSGNDEIIGLHQFYQITVGCYNILNCSLAVIDEAHWGKGLGRKATKTRLHHDLYDCSFATLRTFSPRVAEHYTNLGFYTPLTHLRDKELDKIGKSIGKHFKENIDNNLMISTIGSYVPTFDFLPVQAPSENIDLLNNILQDKTKRMRMIKRLS